MAHTAAARRLAAHFAQTCRPTVRWTSSSAGASSSSAIASQTTILRQMSAEGTGPAPARIHAHAHGSNPFAAHDTTATATATATATNSNTNSNSGPQLSLESLIPGLTSSTFGSWVAEFDTPTAIAPLTLHLIFQRKKMRVQLAGPTGLLFVLTPRMMKVSKPVMATSECGAIVVKEAMRRIRELSVDKLSNPEAHRSIDIQRLLKQGVHVHLKGFGKHRATAVEALDTCGIPIVRLSDVTDIKFAGCRPRNPRRI